MYQTRKYLNKKSLVGLYNSYIYPYLIYCVESWENVEICHLDPLFILQKKKKKKKDVMHNTALRTATGCTQDTNIQHLHDETLTLPIHEHLQLHASQYKHKT